MKKVFLFLILIFEFIFQLEAQNLLPLKNGEFENTNASNFTYWTNRVDNGGVANFSIITDNLILGSTKALKSKVINLGPNGFNTSTISNYGFQVEAGKKYEVSLYAKKDETTLGKLKIVFQSSNNFQSINKTITNTWKEYKHTFTAEKNATDLQIKFWYLNSNTTYYLDNVSVIEVVNTSPNNVKIDVSQTFQTVDGFGGGIKRKTKELFELNNITRKQIEKYCFEDLEVNMIRFFVYHTLETSNDNSDPFLLDETKLDWRRYDSGFNQQNFFVGEALNNAFSLSVNGFDEIIGNCNSAPGWLKTNGSHANGGTLISGGEDEYSEFLLGFLKGMKSKYNIDVTAISPSNEPDYEVTYESMNTTPFGLNGIIKNLNSRLLAESLQDIKIISPECFRVHSTTNPEVSTTNYINEMFNDWDVKSAVDVVASHTYADKGHNADWKALRASSSGKPIWITESANLNFEDISMVDATNYAKWILRGFNEGGISAYMVHLFYEGNNTQNSGSALVIWDTKGNIILPKRYFVMKHFANLVKRGYQLISSYTTLSNVMVGAFKSPDGKKVVLQILNEGATRNILLDVPLKTLTVSHYITSNSETENFTLTNDITFASGDDSISLTIPTMSMHSVVYDIGTSLSITENKSNIINEIMLYPNPAHQKVSLFFPENGNYDLTLYQLNGVKLFENQLSNTSSYSFNINNLASGLYLIEIKSSKNNVSKTLKFIKK